MTLQGYYEDSYREEKTRSPQDLLQEEITSSKVLTNFVLESKNKFLADVDWNGLKVLELGSGRGGVGLHLARLGAKVTLVDFSPTALAQAERLYSLEGFEVKTHAGDVTHPDLILNDQFDIIVDSHLLHCLTEDPDRSSFYGLVADHLSPRGILVSETMVHRKKLFIPDGFMFDARNVLWQMFGKWTPVRRILDSLDLEAEIKNTELKIVSFFYYAQYSFVPHKHFMEIPGEVLPASVRMVLQKEDFSQVLA
ncbi:MAG: class I SAM-dependent methyltransferase [Bdellovibrionota bacterium]